MFCSFPTLLPIFTFGSIYYSHTLFLFSVKIHFMQDSTSLQGTESCFNNFSGEMKELLNSVAYSYVKKFMWEEGKYTTLP